MSKTLQTWANICHNFLHGNRPKIAGLAEFNADRLLVYNLYEAVTDATNKAERDALADPEHPAFNAFMFKARIP